MMAQSIAINNYRDLWKETCKIKNMCDVKQYYIDFLDDDYVYSHKYVMTIANVLETIYRLNIRLC